MFKKPRWRIETWDDPTEAGINEVRMTLHMDHPDPTREQEEFPYGILIRTKNGRPTSLKIVYHWQNEATRRYSLPPDTTLFQAKKLGREIVERMMQNVQDLAHQIQNPEISEEPTFH